MNIKNAKAYIGTIKECLDIENYDKHGETTYIKDMELNSITFGYLKPNIKIINNQAILIKNKYNSFYEFKLTNSFFDNIKIIFDSNNCLYNKPINDGEIFYDETTLVPYYNEQPKVLNLRKLKKDLLQDPRLKIKIDK